MTIARSRAWHAWAPLNLALVGFVLFFAGLRLARPGTVFYYTEGPVLGSLAAFEAHGDLADLYPADGWVEPPVVLTLYPPAYFALAAGVDYWAGTGGTFTGLRTVSALAFLGILALLSMRAWRRRVPPTWILAIAGAALLTPGVYRVVAGAQADTLALLFTWVGISAALGTRGTRIRVGVLPLSAAATAFFLAFFSKQSFVAAPAALTVGLLLERRTRAAVIFASGLATAVGLTVLVLDASTSGGYLANTLGALTGSSGWANLVSSLRESRPLQWIPLAAVVLVASRGRAPGGFAELYLLTSTVLHAVAMLKTGSSVNYFLEPTFALMLLAVTRWEPCGEPGKRSSSPAPAATRTARVAVVLLATAMGLGAAQAAVREYRLSRGWLAGAGSAHVADFEGYPLVDALFVPAVLERKGRPWLNDPFAFGVLEETGQWDPSPLISDLEDRQIPFALTTVDLNSGPAPAGVGTRDLVFAYFWRSSRVWTALTEYYRASSTGPVTVWLPREDEEVGEP